MANETIPTVPSIQAGITVGEKIIVAISLSAIVIITLLGNLTVIAVFCMHKPLRKFANSFLVSLAVSDIMVGAIDMPIWMVNIVCDCSYNKLLLDVWVCMDIFSGMASILNLTAVSVCRFIEIKKPYQCTEIITKQRTIGSLVAIWIFGGIMAMLKGLLPANTDQWYYQPGYQLLVFIVSFVTPLIGISYCYINIFKEVTRQRNELPKKAKSAQQKTWIATDMKAIKTIAIVIVVFVLCWCPFLVVVLVNGFCKCVSNRHLIVLVKVMHYCNSFLNPIIYVWHNNQYRKAFISALIKFAHLYGAEFVVTFLNKKAKENEQEGREMQRILLLRS